MTKQQNDLGTPWSLHFDRDGTEDYGIICDAEGNQIAASHVCGKDEWDKGTFWLPEKNDPVPITVRQLRLMTASPKMVAALEACFAMLGRYHATATGNRTRDRIDKVREEVFATLSEARGETAF